MAAEYPGAVPTIAADKANATVSEDDHAPHHNKLAEEVVAIAAELGTDPAGSFSTVKARLDGSLRVGLLSNLGAASSYPNGQYFATDDNGGTLYVSDGTDWHIVGPRNVRLASHEREAGHTTASLAAGATEDIPSASVTFTARDRPVQLSAGFPVWGTGSNSARPRFGIRDTGGTFLTFSGYNAGAEVLGRQGPHVVKTLDDLVAGNSYTYKLSIHNAAGASASTITALGLTGIPIYLYADEV